MARRLCDTRWHLRKQCDGKAPVRYRKSKTPSVRTGYGWHCLVIVGSACTKTKGNAEQWQQTDDEDEDEDEDDDDDDDDEG